MIDGRRITEIIRKKVTKAQQHFHHSIHYQSFLPILPDWRSNVLDNGENAASHFKPRSKETPSPSPFPPKIYNAILDISTIRITAKNPLKNLIRVFAFGFLTDYHRFPYYGIQQRFQKLVPSHEVIPVTEDANRFRNLLASQADPPAILATRVEDSRYIAEKGASNVARLLSRVQDSSTGGGEYVSNLPRCVGI